MLGVARMKRHCMHRSETRLVVSPWDDVAPTISADGPPNRPPHRGRSDGRDRHIEEHENMRACSALRNEHERFQSQPNASADGGGRHLPSVGFAVVRIDIDHEVRGPQTTASMLAHAIALANTEKRVRPDAGGAHQMSAEGGFPGGLWGRPPTFAPASLFIEGGHRMAGEQIKTRV